jgi:hypothetical protein
MLGQVAGCVAEFGNFARQWGGQYGEAEGEAGEYCA